MTKQTISLGASANDGTGDTLRQAGQKINDNFDEVYARLNPLVHNPQSISANGTIINPAASAIFIDNSINCYLGDGNYLGEVKYLINVGSNTSSVNIGVYGPDAAASSVTLDIKGQVIGFIWHTSGWYLLSNKTIK